MGAAGSEIDRSGAVDPDTRLESLEARVEQMQLMLNAMRELLQSSHTIAEAELLGRMKEIDQRDGSSDGVMGEAIDRHCNSCGRVVGSRGLRCLYCGSTDLSLLETEA